MYLIKTYPEDRSKLEMCFDCTNYQGQFPPDVPFGQHISQTIYLNNQRDDNLWSIDEIDKNKIIRKDWWHQLCHSWTHYAFVVPWMWLLRQEGHTICCRLEACQCLRGCCHQWHRCGADLGATYPEDLELDKFALPCLRMYYLLAYGKWYRRKAAKGGEEKDRASGLYGSVFQGPDIVDRERLTWKEENGIKG